MQQGGDACFVEESVSLSHVLLGDRCCCRFNGCSKPVPRVTSWPAPTHFPPGQLKNEEPSKPPTELLTAIGSGNRSNAINPKLSEIILSLSSADAE